jgi:hypothetical protein
MKRWSPQQDSHWTKNNVFGSQTPKLEILASIVTFGNIKISKPYRNPGRSFDAPPGSLTVGEKKVTLGLFVLYGNESLPLILHKNSEKLLNTSPTFCQQCRPCPMVFT